METTQLWLRLRLIAVAISVLAVAPPELANAQPQIKLLSYGCSQYSISNTRDFFNNLNTTFAALGTELSSGGGSKRFATTQHPVYAMVQCRNYMSEGDCLACFAAAVSRIRNCSAANGARVIYDGCFLRYESNKFYDQTTLPGNVQICGKHTASQPASFKTEGLAFLKDLEVATPRINGYFAASTRAISTGGNVTIYGVAQCAETVTQSGCQDCLTVAYGNIQGCLPRADGRAVDAACFIRYSETPFFADNQTVDITPFLGSGGGNSRCRNAIIGGVLGGGGLVLILIALFLRWRYYYSRKSKATSRGLRVKTPPSIISILKVIFWEQRELQGPTVCSYKDLKSATKNFSEENKLGEGGFGDVYKATLKNGNIVAVKKLDISYTGAKADFESEVSLLSNVHHRNLVRLLGCSSKGSELLLVYEYMANRSLDRFLYGEKRGMLSWKQRIDIILGTARGLAYLHEQYHKCIIHRDIKPGNILLDDNFQAKIADFGLARLLPENQSHVSTKFAGTLGYTAPEYAVHGHLSEKVDTYSFGVVILEIISGRRGCDVNPESDTEYLLEEAWKLYETGEHHKLADETLDPNEYKPEDFKNMLEIALSCTQSPASRPSMSEILVMLLSDRAAEQKGPTRSSFSYRNKFVSETYTSVSTESPTSNATVSISQFTGR